LKHESEKIVQEIKEHTRIARMIKGKANIKGVECMRSDYGLKTLKAQKWSSIT